MPDEHAMDETAGGDATWTDENVRGLAFAAAGAWPQATEAFSAAFDLLTDTKTNDPAAHEALALVLGNLAQSSFHSGDHDSAVRHSQRASALRVALFGEDAVCVARARSDLAVLLASSGRAEESPALIARAIAGIEQSAGADDLRLAVVLENAARIALARGEPLEATPMLERLSDLLTTHGVDTARSDALQALIFGSPPPSLSESERVDGPWSLTESDEWDILPVETASHEAPYEDAFEQTPAERRDVEQPSAAHAESAIPEMSGETGPDYREWEDQPLRDAVAMTDHLLRTTPRGIPAVSEMAVQSDDRESPTPIVDDARDATHAPMPEAQPDQPEELDFLEIDDIEMTDVELMDVQLMDVELTDAASTMPLESLEPLEQDILGFEIQHHMPLLSGSYDSVMAAADLPAVSAVPAVEAADAGRVARMGADAPTPHDAAEPEMPESQRLHPQDSAPAAITPAIDAMPGSPARPDKVETSAADTAANAPQASRTQDTVPPNDQPAGRPHGKRQAPRIPSMQREAKSSRGPMIGAGLAAVAVAIAGWYFANGGF